MALSNYIPSSRVMQPGVCTSTTRPASPYEGMVIYETDTNKTYVWNGSAWVMMVAADSPPGLELVGGVGCSSGGTVSNGVVTIGSAVSSVTVTNAFSSIYDNYLITISNCQVTGGQFWLRIGSKTTNYYWGLTYNEWGATPKSLGSTNDTYWKYVGSEGQGKIDVFIPVTGPFLSSPTRIGPCSYADAGAGGVMMGYDAANTSYTSFVLSNSLGNLTGGTIRVYGYRNSI